MDIALNFIHKINWIDVIRWIGDIIAVDAVIKQVALKYGFKRLASLCDIIATGVNFVLDIITGLIGALKNRGGSNVSTNSTGSGTTSGSDVKQG
jgi:hypothetical protein